MSDDESVNTSALVDLVGLHKTLAMLRRSYERGEIDWPELQRYELQCEQTYGWNSGSMGRSNVIPLRQRDT